MRKMVEALRKTSWKDKLLLLQIMVVSFVIIINIVTIFLCVRVYFEQQISFSAEQNIAQAQVILDRVVSDNKKAMDEVTRDERIISLISSQSDFMNGNDSEILSGYNEYKYMISKLNEIQQSYNIENIKIYMRSGYVYDAENRISYPWKDVMSPKWMEKLRTEGVNSIFLDNSYFDYEMTQNKLFHHIQVIKSSTNYQEIIGVMHIPVSEEFIQNLLIKSKLSQNSVLYLENSQGDIVTQIDKAASSKKYKTFRVGVPHSDLSLVSKISMDDMMKMYYMIVLITISISLILLLIGIFASKTIINNLTKKMILLINHMEKTKDRIFEPVPLNEVYDDVDRSIEGYNKLLCEFEKILEEQKRNAENTKRLELKILREQINPHFLYNTLEIINSLAIINEQTEISDVAKWMSEYYKLTLNHGEDLMTVREELRHAELYIKLQNLRFDKNIVFLYDVPEEILDRNILKMIMQPIIENSVKHGFKDKVSDDNTISIVAYDENEYMIFIINDNGLGIPEEKICTLLLKSSSDFGLNNVNERIKLFYGEDCGISIESKYGVYTSVIIKIAHRD